MSDSELRRGAQVVLLNNGGWPIVAVGTRGWIKSYDTLERSALVDFEGCGPVWVPLNYVKIVPDTEGGRVPIPLPPEPPRDRVIEAVDADGNVVERWAWREFSWRRETQPGGQATQFVIGAHTWGDVMAMADRESWSLRHVPAEGGEKP